MWNLNSILQVQLMIPSELRRKISVFYVLL